VVFTSDTVSAVQPVIAVPPAEKATVPPGAMGEKATPPSVAVKVTEALTAELPVGAVTVTVGSSFVTVWSSAGEFAELKFASPR
jgi:hypothetical protein